MKFITKWFLDNPVAANLLMVFIIIAGLLSMNSLRVESFPQIPPSELIISVAYPGGTAKQVDEGITQRIEDAISGVAGIKNITSTSSAGHARVRVKKSTGVDLDKLIENVRNNVESIVGFPSLAERPSIYRNEFDNLASFVMVYGGNDDTALQQVATNVQNALKKHPKISQVTNLGKREKLLTIAPDIDALKQYGLSISALQARIEEWSLEYRSGELRTAQGNITLRGDGYANNLVKLKRLPVVVNENASVYLEDVAKVTRDYRKTDSIVKYQGKAAIALLVSTSQKDNLFDVSSATQDVLAKAQLAFPDGVQVEMMADMAPYISEQLDLLSTNAWQGLVIVIVLLGIFLEVKLALWVALGIPISLAGAVWLMGLPALDYSINDITLFGMILVLGILVDDAVVVGESIHEARRTEPDPKKAAFKGVEKVAVATIFGVLTTIAAFSPMLWIENELAQVLAGFSAVVIFALIFSLIESKFILPVHLANISNKAQQQHIFARALASVRARCVGGLQHFSETIYQPILRTALSHKKTALLLFFTIMLAAYVAMLKGSIKTVFFPDIPGRYATVKVTMDDDAPLSLTQRIIGQIEQATTTTNEQIKANYALDELPMAKAFIASEGAYSIEMTAELTTTALAEIPGEDILGVWQENIGDIEGSYAVTYSLADEPAGGTAISVASTDRDLARHVAKTIKTELQSIAGVNDVYDDSQGGKRKLQLTLTDRGIQLGVTQQQLATLAGGVFGELEVHRLLDKAEETKVIVQLPESERKTIEQLKAAQVQLAKNSYVALGEISAIEYSREPELLYRRNRDAVVNIYWRQNRAVNSPENVLAELEENVFPQLRQLYPTISINAAGEFAEISEVQAGFKKAMLLTILLIYILLAIPLKSYWQPFIIMSVIPFGFAGAVYGHAIMGLSVSLLSMFGMMAMMGVVVNDSLVLMTRFNNLYAEGMPMKEALIEAGRSRLQAIFLTTVTTVCGLLPLLAETSEQAQYLKPAAVSLVFGELLATPITLILIPILLSFGRYKKVKAPENVPEKALN